ncbi:MAG: glycosyltransferase family 4 protein [Anaerolineae bacterium]
MSATGILELIKALPKDEYRVYFTSPSVPSADQRRILEQYAADIALIPNGGLWTRPKLSLIQTLAAEAKTNLRTAFHIKPQIMLRQALKQWQIDLVYSTSVLINDPAISARLMGLPHLWHIKERVGKQGITHFYLPDSLLAQAITKLANRVIVMSDYIAEFFAQQQQMAKVIKIADGLNPAEFDSPQLVAKARALRQRLGIPERALVVGLVASINSAWKRHELFIEAAAQIHREMPDVLFVHFGPIPQQDGLHRTRYLSLQKLASSLGVADRILWAGEVSNIPVMMASLNLLIHPTAVEPFGRVAIEAMASGVPVIGPSVGGIAESVVDKQTGLLVEPNSADALAQAGLELLRDPDKLERLGIAARQHVREHFSIQRHVDQIMKVIDIELSA